MRNLLYVRKHKNKDDPDIDRQVQELNVKIKMLRKKQRIMFTEQHRDAAASATASYETARHHLDVAFDTLRELHRDAASQVDKDDD